MREDPRPRHGEVSGSAGALGSHPAAISVGQGLRVARRDSKRQRVADRCLRVRLETERLDEAPTREQDAIG